MIYKQRILDIFVFLCQLSVICMKKILITTLFLLVIGSICVKAQVVQTLKNDPRVLKGTMNNGLNYYIIKNEGSKNLADFYLVQKSGTNIEKDATKDITSHIVDMALRGTRNFPGTEMTEFLKRLGIVVAKDVAINVGREETMFKVANVPINKNAAVTDSMLLVLYNWANSINFDEDDNKFSNRELRSFYYEWFRPNLQAVVVVGNVDQKSVQSKIVSLFQAAPRSVSSEIPPVANLDMSNKVIVNDKVESSNVEIDYSFVSKCLPPNLKLSATPLIINYCNAMLSYLIKDRVLLLTRESNNQLLKVSCTSGEYRDYNNYEVLNLNIVSTPSFATTLFYNVSNEIKRIVEEGFTEMEYNRALNRYYKELRHRYYTREQTPNDYYAQKAIDNFTRGYSLASIELMSEFMEKVKLQLTHKQFNTYVQALLGNKDGCFITVNQKGGNSDFEEIFEEVMAGISTPFVNVHLPSNLVSKQLAGGTIIQRMDEPISKSTVYTLSNGATVVLKHSSIQRGRVSFEAIAKGGLSMMNSVSQIDPRVLNLGTLGAENAVNIQRYKADRDVVLEKEISLGEDRFVGEFYSQDLNSFLALLYLNFNSYGGDRDAFERFLSINREEQEMASQDVEEIFEKYVEQVQYTNTIKDPDYSDPSYYENTLRFLKQRLSNVADYTFIFVGDFVVKDVEPLVLKYIGSLSGNPAQKSTWRTLPFYFKKQSGKYKVKVPKGKSLNYYSIKFPTQFDPYNILLSQVASEIIINRYYEDLQQLGVCPSTNYEFMKYPEEFGVLELRYANGDNNAVQKVIEDANAQLSSSGVSQNELSYVKTVIKEDFMSQSQYSNEFWIEIIRGRFLYGKDFYTRYLSSLDAITLDLVNAKIKEQIENGHQIIVATEEVK